MRRFLPILTLLAMLVGCTPTAPVAVTRVAQAKATPTPAPPTEPPTPQPLPPAAPFTLAVTDIQLESGSNAGIFGLAAAPVDEGAALAAVQVASDRMSAFLNAMFVSPDTRLQTAAVAVLVDPATLVPEAIAGLGALDRPDVLGTVTGQATGLATVLIDGASVGAVTMRYAASAELVLAAGQGPVEQTGTATFADRGAGLELVGIQANTIYGGDLAAVVS